MTRRHRNGMAAIGSATVAVLIVSGCSSSAKKTTVSPTAAASTAASASAVSPTTAGSAAASSVSSPAAGSAVASTSTVSAVVSAAEAQVAEFTKTQPDITVAALKSTPPTGKTIAILSCAFPSCQAETNAAADGARKLGWTAKAYTSDPTPEAYQSTWNRMLQSPPDLIVYIALLPDSFISAELATVQKLKIPLVAIVGSDAPGGVMRAVMAGPALIGESGKLMGDAVVADAQGAAKTVFVWDPTLAQIFGPVKTAFTQQVTAANGSVDVLNVSTAEIGKAIPGQVVSYLQAHPDVKYVAFTVSDLVVGAPQALKGAGISGVKILSRLPTAANLADVKDGAEWVEVGEENATGGYRSIDTLARILEGLPFDTAPVGWHQIFTKDNVTQTSTDPSTPGSPQAFFTAWHVS